MAGTKEKAISNEQIIAALLSNGTVKAAATCCGISERAIYDRMRTKDFKMEYRAAKNDVIRGAVDNLNAHLSEAVDAIADIMQDPANNAAVRLQAAQTILNNAGKLSDKFARDERNSEMDGMTLDEMIAYMM